MCMQAFRSTGKCVLGWLVKIGSFFWPFICILLKGVLLCVFSLNICFAGACNLFSYFFAGF